MRVIKFTGSNDVLPIDGRECSPAPCVRTTFAGVQTITTYWELSDGERRSIAAGGLVRIEVFAGEHPPFSVITEPRP